MRSIADPTKVSIDTVATKLICYSFSSSWSRPNRRIGFNETKSEKKMNNDERETSSHGKKTRQLRCGIYFVFDVVFQKKRRRRRRRGACSDSPFSLSPCVAIQSLSESAKRNEEATEKWTRVVSYSIRKSRYHPRVVVLFFFSARFSKSVFTGFLTSSRHQPHQRRWLVGCASQSALGKRFPANVQVFHSFFLLGFTEFFNPRALYRRRPQPEDWPVAAANEPSRKWGRGGASRCCVLLLLNFWVASSCRRPTSPWRRWRSTPTASASSTSPSRSWTWASRSWSRSPSRSFRASSASWTRCRRKSGCVWLSPTWASVSSSSSSGQPNLDQSAQFGIDNPNFYLQTKTTKTLSWVFSWPNLTLPNPIQPNPTQPNLT